MSLRMCADSEWHDLESESSGSGNGDSRVSSLPSTEYYTAIESDTQHYVRPGCLPWRCVFFVWILAFVMLAVFGFITLMSTLNLGPQQAMYWAQTVAVGFVFPLSDAALLSTLCE